MTCHGHVCPLFNDTWQFCINRKENKIYIGVQVEEKCYVRTAANVVCITQV